MKEKYDSLIKLETALDYPGNPKMVRLLAVDNDWFVYDYLQYMNRIGVGYWDPDTKTGACMTIEEFKEAGGQG